MPFFFSKILLQTTSKNMYGEIIDNIDLNNNHAKMNLTKKKKKILFDSK